MEQKYLAKTLATRLNKLLGKLVNPDQTGFVSGRSFFNNLRCLFNILYSSQTNRSDLVMLSFDAEKAFDQVEWPYLFTLLQKFHVGEKFITWLKILYKNPRARIHGFHVTSHSGAAAICRTEFTVPSICCAVLWAVITANHNGLFTKRCGCTGFFLLNISRKHRCVFTFWYFI